MSGPPNSAASSDLGEFLHAYRHDPLGFVLAAFPWGEGELTGKQPRAWQRERLSEIGDALRSRVLARQYEPVQVGTASGHGIGKSALVAWLILWSMATCADTRGVVTANTDGQLRTKTWPELAKWHRFLIEPIRAQFTFTATAYYSNDSAHEKTWRVDMLPWSEHNTEAFAGLHNAGNRILLLFDEASAIPDIIWETVEGALTDEETEIVWAVFGNPTRNTGRFRDCFGRFKHRWLTRAIDSRTVEGTNKSLLDRWVADYGEDSDFVRYRVRGLFPRASSMQFIDTEIVELAAQREPLVGIRDPLVMGIDVARGGEDEFVICYRRGLDGQSIPWVTIPGSEARDSMRIIAKVVDLATTTDQYRRPDAVFVDATGIGGPIVDRLKQLLGDLCPVFAVGFGESSPDAKLANMRMYIWWKMREWLRLGGSIPNDPELHRQLCESEYAHDKRDRLILEAKESLKARGLASPDRADALAVTFAYPVMPREQTAVTGNTSGRAVTDYDPMANA